MQNFYLLGMIYESRSSFEKDAIPHMLHEGCSHARECAVCAYELVLNEIYP